MTTDSLKHNTNSNDVNVLLLHSADDDDHNELCAWGDLLSCRYDTDMMDWFYSVKKPKVFLIVPRQQRHISLIRAAHHLVSSIGCRFTTDIHT